MSTVQSGMTPTGPFIMVIFGATGDLTARKLMPALYKLYRFGQISHNTFIVGVGRREMEAGDFRELMREAAQSGAGSSFDLDTWGELADGMDYTQGYFEDPGLYERLITVLSRFDNLMKACVPRFFYLATPPQNYETILSHLDASTLAEGCGQGTTNFTRVFIEKPFGKDLKTANHLERLLSSIFEERQIYRIDHYLGKETLQNILAFRFGNGMFEPTWNREFIDHVQITLSEDMGVGSRGQFYDGIGAMRDVVQNHMLQMMALVAMEEPRAFDAASIRKERHKAMAAIVPVKPSDVGALSVRGQYQSSIVGGHAMRGYRQEKGVAPGSTTETFMALKLVVQTRRWRGVPFYLRTGKRLASKVTEISLHFKKPDVLTNHPLIFPPDKVLRNVLTIHVQPEEGIHLRLMVKRPGFGMRLSPAYMHFSYLNAFPDAPKLEAYERLLLDAINGDATLFARTDEIKASWKLVTDILEGWEARKIPLHPYTPGTWGPPAATEFIERDGRHWFLHGV